MFKTPHLSQRKKTAHLNREVYLKQEYGDAKRIMD